MTTDSALNSQRVFKKASPNNKLTLYLTSRDLVVENGSIDKIQGVLHVDTDNLENKKLFGQVTLTFRYGREDEEVMGLKFCNEAIMSLAQIWPVHCNLDKEPNTPLQEALLKRLGSNAFPFHLELTPLAPPSVQLVPAKQYHGAPIGTSYDVRAYIAERADEKVSRRNTVRMGIRVLQGPGKMSMPPTLPPHSPHHTLSTLAHHNVLRLKNKAKLESNENCRTQRDKIETVEPTPARATVEKPFLLSDGRVELEAWLDKATYSHGESISVSAVITNNSSRTVRRIKTLVVQHVDVCMFSNGKFKNVVALIKGTGTPVLPGQTLTDTYTLTPHKGVTKNWIALEDSYSKSGASLASTVLCNSDAPEDRNVFAIYVSYYVKVKLTLSTMGGEVSLKLPFTLTHSCINEAPTDSVIEEATHKMILEGITKFNKENKLRRHYNDPHETITVKIKEHHLEFIKVELEAWLDKATYSHGESISVSAVITNNSSRTVRRIKTLVVQHVDVCMFSNGKFKNVVALIKGTGTPVLPGQTLTDTYTLTPHKGVTKNWIALEDSYSKSGASLASTVLCNSDAPEDRNVFAIYVSYYVKVKLTLSTMGGEVSLKLPFTLTHSCINEAPTDSVIEEATHKMILEGKENSEDEDSKAETAKDKQNNNGNENDGTRVEAEDKPNQEHRCIADVLVNIENKISDRPKKFEGQTVRNVKQNEEELDLIVKYPGSDT